VTALEFASTLSVTVMAAKSIAVTSPITLFGVMLVPVCAPRFATVPSLVCPVAGDETVSAHVQRRDAIKSFLIIDNLTYLEQGK
jgi:hypothetical protein